jgi:hypothetical protein
MPCRHAFPSAMPSAIDMSLSQVLTAKRPRELMALIGLMAKKAV